jgi:glycosyltransferase involved in cell wall biosynthesis
MSPLVTVVCTCYNHEKFLKESLDSVFNQTYPFVEVIIVDDASTDKSREFIQSYVSGKTEVVTIFNEKNKGICASFNQALRKANGKYIIDLATDDVMELNKVEKQVNFFEKLDESYAVVYTNSMYIDEHSKNIRTHFIPGQQVTQGNIYSEIIRRFFLPSASLMVRTKVLHELGGYDESLAYEDFDFWVRSSRNYKYAYLDEVLIRYRTLKNSLRTRFYKPQGTAMLESTYRVCQKALWLNKTNEENQALCQRIQYEMKQAFLMENFALVKKYQQLMKDAGGNTIFSSCVAFLSKLKIPVNKLYSIYLRLKGRL